MEEVWAFSDPRSYTTPTPPHAHICFHICVCVCVCVMADREESRLADWQTD